MRDKEPSPSRCDPNLRPGFMSRPPAMWRWWILLMLLLVPAGVPGEPSLPIPLQTRTFFTEWGSAAPRGQQPVCLDIPSNLSLCYGVGYRQMRLPNLLEHDTMAEVGQQAASWVPLVNIRCHGDAQLFLCSLFSPVCLDRPIYPCRSLCEQVRRGCEGRMRAHGYPWPDMFRCDKFPRDNDMCISSQSDPQPQPAQPQGPETSPDDSAEEHVVENANDECRPCKQVDTYENVLDNLCRADFAVRARLRGRAGRGAGRSAGRGSGRRAHARGARGHRGSQPHSDGDLRTARVLKAAGPVVRKMVRDSLPALPPPSSCPACAHEPHFYLVMGSVGSDKELRITLVLPWTTKSRAIKKAVRTFTNTNCSNPNLVSRTVIVDTYTPIEFGGLGNPLPPIQLPPTITTAATTAAAPTTTSTTTTTTSATTSTTTTTTTPRPETTTTQTPSPSPSPPRPRPAGRNRGNGARNRQNGQNPYRSRRPDTFNEVQGVHLTRGSHVTTPSSGDFFDGHMHRHRRPDAGSPLWHSRPQLRSTTSPSTSTHSTTYTPMTPTTSTTTRMTSTTIMPAPIAYPATPTTVAPTTTAPTSTSLASTTTPYTTTSTTTSPAPTTTPSTTTSSTEPTPTTSTTTSPAPTTTPSTTTSTTPGPAPTTTPPSTTSSTEPTTTTSTTTSPVPTTTTSTTTSTTASPGPTTTPPSTTSSTDPTPTTSTTTSPVPTTTSSTTMSTTTELTPMTTTTVRTTTTANDVWSRWAVPTRTTSAYLPPWMTTTSTTASPTSHYRPHIISTRWYPSPWKTSSTTSTTSSWLRESGTLDWYTQRPHLASESSTERTTSATSLYHSIRREPVVRSSTYSPTLSKYWETAVIASTGEGSYGKTEIVSTTPSRAWSSAVTPSTTYRYHTEAPSIADRSSSPHSSSTTSTEAVPRPRRPTTSDWWLARTQSTSTWRPPTTEQAASSRKAFKESPPSSPRPRHKQRRPKNRRRMKQRQPTREGEIPLPKTLVNLFERA